MMIISVRVTPNAKKPEVKMTGENEYSVRVDAPADKGKANARLIEILSRHFGVKKSSISIEKGHKSRDKIVEVKG